MPHVLGHGTAAALWLGSALLPASARVAVWMTALVLDLSTPWASVRHSVRTPPHPAHLPERVGLFTLILLGESVVAVMKVTSDPFSSSPVTSSLISSPRAFDELAGQRFQGTSHLEVMSGLHECTADRSADTRTEQ